MPPSPGAPRIATDEVIPWPIGKTACVRPLAGDHPNVRVLVAAFLPGASVGAFETPPMLAAAWEVLTDRAATNDELIPADSFSSAVAVAKWGAGAWLSWLLDELPTVTQAKLPVLEMAAAGDVPVDATLPSNPMVINADLSSSFERVRQQLNLVEQRRDRLNVLEKAVVCDPDRRACDTPRSQRGRGRNRRLTRRGIRSGVVVLRGGRPMTLPPACTARHSREMT